jgi:hypothetical protein
MKYETLDLNRFFLLNKKSDTCKKLKSNLVESRKTKELKAHLIHFICN